MQSNVFQKATRQSKSLKIALAGISGAGKTLTALYLAQGMCPAGKRIALVDTENKSASLYSNIVDFDTVTLDDHNPQNFINLIDNAIANNFGVLILDSSTHAYDGNNGLLQLVAKEELRTRNKWTAWARPSELWTQFVRKIISANIHIIVTMRSKTKYAQTEKDANNKSTVIKLGLEPIMKSEFEYEFDVFAELDRETHQIIVNKTRIPILDNSVLPPATPELGMQIVTWLNDGTIDSNKLATNDEVLEHKIDSGEFNPQTPKASKLTPSELATLTTDMPKVEDNDTMQKLEEVFPDTPDTPDRKLTATEAQNLADLAVRTGYTPNTAGKALNTIGITGKLTDCNFSQMMDITRVFTDKSLCASLKGKR